MKAFALLVYVHAMDFFGLLFVAWVIAARRGHVNAIKKLLATYPSGFRTLVALSRAAENGHGEVVELLLDNGADPNLSPGITHFAVVSGSVRVVEALLAAGADPNAVIAEDVTPLHLAAGRDNAAMIQSLLADGANPLAADSNGMRPVDQSTEGSAAAAILSAAAEQARGKRAEPMEPPPVALPASAAGPVVHAVADNLPSLPPVPRSEARKQPPALPRNRAEFRRELAHLDAIGERMARSRIDADRWRVERGDLPVGPFAMREWVDEGPTLTFTAPRHRAEPDQELDVDPTVAALARLCDTVLQRHEPPIKWSVADPNRWRDRLDERINLVLVASPRNIVVHAGRYSPTTLARAMSYQQSRDPHDNEGKWLTTVRDLLKRLAPRSYRGGRESVDVSAIEPRAWRAYQDRACGRSGLLT